MLSLNVLTDRFEKIMPYIVALSGGVASGKSTVANLFAQRGVPIVDADIIAKQVVAKGSPVLKHLTHHFGESILLADGHLDRSQLRAIIFNNPQERQWLNHCLHPLIQQATDQQISQLHDPYVIWVVPLLIENNLQTKADRVLIIDTAPEIQLTRLTRRDNISESLAKNMLLSQATNTQRITHADDIISNNGDAIALSWQVEQLHNKYLELSQITVKS